MFCMMIYLDTEIGLVLVLTLGYHLGSDLDLGLEDGVQEVLAVNAQQEGGLLSLCKKIDISPLSINVFTVWRRNQYVRPVE